jgi:hypothetical protein
MGGDIGVAQHGRLQLRLLQPVLDHVADADEILAGMSLKLLAETMGTSIQMLEYHYAKFIAASPRQADRGDGAKAGAGRIERRANEAAEVKTAPAGRAARCGSLTHEWWLSG